MNKVSVIVPVYNTNPEYLKICIDSILSQDHTDIELLMVNDGSGPETGTLCGQLASSDPRIVYISTKNMGVSVARNTALDAATGDYVLFVDSDDFISPSLLSLLTEKIGENTDILFFGYCTSYKNRELNRVIKNPDPKLFTPDTLQLSILNANPRLGPLEVGAPWGKLIRRSVIEKDHIRYTPGLKKGQDTVFTLHLLEHCRVVSYEPVTGYHYRVSDASISHRYSPDMVAIMEKTLHAYASFIEEYAKGPVFRKALLMKYYRVLTGEYLELCYMHPDNPGDEKELMRSYLQLTEREPYSGAIAAVSKDSMKGLDRIVYGLVRSGNIKSLWALNKALRLAKRLIVKSYG